MTTTELPPEVAAVPSARQQVQDSHQVIAQARALVVSNPQEYEAAAGILQSLRGAFKKLDEERKAITGPIDAAKARVMAFFKPHSDAVQEAGELVRGKLVAYDTEQARIAAEAARKAEEEARRQRAAAEAKARQEREAAEAKAKAEREEADRQRREQEAAQRRADEQRAAQERAQREAEEAKRRGDSEAARLAEEEANRAEASRKAEEARAEQARKEALRADTKADNAEARGEVRAAEHENTAASIVAQVVQTEAPKVSGIARKKVWKYRIKDPSAIKRAYLTEDEVKIGKLVRAMGAEAADMVGGIEVWQENDVAARAK
jgi:hypothetical protein